MKKLTINMNGQIFLFVVVMMSLFLSLNAYAQESHQASLKGPEKWLEKSCLYEIKLGFIQKRIIDNYDKNGENSRVPRNLGTTGNMPFTIKITRLKPGLNDGGFSGGNSRIEEFSGGNGNTWGDHVEIYADFYPALNTKMFFYLPTAEFEKQLLELRNSAGNAIAAVRCYDVPSNILFIEINRKKNQFRFTVVRTEPTSGSRNCGEKVPSPTGYKTDSEFQKAMIQYRFDLTKKILMGYLPADGVVWTDWTRL